MTQSRHSRHPTKQKKPDATEKNKLQTTSIDKIYTNISPICNHRNTQILSQNKQYTKHSLSCSSTCKKASSTYPVYISIDLESLAAAAIAKNKHKNDL